ncbi:MAG: nucleotide exchange factor GrpE [Chloroflexaceae bacterium]|nr:nucleotide exchange factor GrpE [Chloroflexaceae bacterium]
MTNPSYQYEQPTKNESGWSAHLRRLIVRLLPTTATSRPRLEHTQTQLHQLDTQLTQVTRQLHTMQTTLADQLNHLSAHVERLPATISTNNSEQVEGLQRVLTALEKQIGRSGREQLKANTLTETQQEQLTQALEQLRATDQRRNEEMAALRKQQENIRTQARLDLIRSLLPVLDSMDEAIRAGQQLLDQPLPPDPTLPNKQPASSDPSLFERLLHRSTPQPASSEPDPSAVALYEHASGLRQSLQSWLVGVTFMQERLLSLLTADQVYPIEAQGQPFDPNIHIAMDVVPVAEDDRAGIVASELRRGYMVGNQVLRHAEVAVTTMAASHQS